MTSMSTVGNTKVSVSSSSYAGLQVLYVEWSRKAVDSTEPPSTGNLIAVRMNRPLIDEYDVPESQHHRSEVGKVEPVGISVAATLTRRRGFRRVSTSLGDAKHTGQLRRVCSGVSNLAGN